MKKLYILSFINIFIVLKVFCTNPDEGMWIPMLLEKLNYADMQKTGLHLKPEELYNINNSSIKDGIVSLDFSCTAEVVSAEGLLFTNHHCAFDAIQEQSSIDKDYLTNGFWALSKEEELPIKDFSCSFLVRIEDVTKRINEKIGDSLSEFERNKEIENISTEIEIEATEGNTYDAKVKSFYNGNEFYLFVYQTYYDIRLVGAPPSSIGKFGGDTDNWMWPRHTGDFSILRIYASPDGKPAYYSKKNIPLKTKYFFPISLKGMKKNDFAMIWGYPGSTNRFLSSYGVKLAIDETNPAIVKIRNEKLSIIKSTMDKNHENRIKYSAKYSSSANYWKYFIGQTKGIKRNKIYDKKLKEEDLFQKKIDSDSVFAKKYKNALPLIKKSFTELSKYNLPITYLNEAVFQGPEIITQSLNSGALYKNLKNNTAPDAAVAELVKNIKTASDDFYKNFDINTDKLLFSHLTKLYYDNVPREYYPEFFSAIEKKFDKNFDKYTDYVYKKSLFTTKEKYYKYLKKPKLKKLEKDPVFDLMLSYFKMYNNISSNIDEKNQELEKGERLYIAGLREIYADKVFYPDANFTMRVTYGKVLDYVPADAVQYDYYTTAKGILEKEDTTNEEFIVPEKLKNEILNKDFGKYADENGVLRICFLANTDITGGNSGSPVLNADGQLVGIAFDGNWEAMSSDIAYEPNLQRTICLDIRYLLFVVDKYAGADNIINELTIIE